MSEPEKLVRWDARYGALQSLLLDLRIALAAATGRGKDEGGAPSPELPS